MNIFNKIEILSYKLSNFIVSKLENLTDKEEQEEKEIWNYFCFMILSQLFTFFFVILFGIIFEYLIYLLFAMISFCSLRIKCGGYHCKTFKQCFITTNLSFFFIGLLSKYFYIYLFDYCVILGLFSFVGVIFIIPTVPLPWGNEESRGSEIDKRFQLQYRNRVICLYIINIILIICDYYFIIEFFKQAIIGLSFGLILASFIGSVLGSKCFENLWENIKNL